MNCRQRCYYSKECKKHKDTEYCNSVKKIVKNYNDRIKEKTLKEKR